MTTPTPSKTSRVGAHIPAPARSCADARCPFHGTISVHGRTFTGLVSSAKASKTISVEFSWKKSIPKYERFETKRTVIKAHVPPCIDVAEGDRVTIMETRPLSKTKNFVVIQAVSAAKLQSTKAVAQS